MTTNKPLERLRHHVSGAIARGEAKAIVAVPAKTQAVNPQQTKIMTTTIGEHFNVTKKLTEDDKSFYRQWLDEASSGYVEDFFYFDEAGKVIAKAQEDAAQGERVQAIPRAIVFRDLMERTLQKLADSAFPKASQLAND